MKKYKHKPTGNIYEIYGHSGNIVNNNNASSMLPLWLTHDSNDWEEIIEKDYLILEIKSVGGCHWIYDEKTKKYVQNKFSFQHCLDDFFEKNVLSSKYFIFKIKRLSDNEIFTIGDKCNDDFIQEIKLVVDENRLYISSKNFSWGKNIKDLTKDKISLFTTEDGKEMYEGDELFELITPGFYNKSCVWNIILFKTKSNINYDQENSKKNGRIWFSTKEAAQEWVVFNKPCLSLNDVKNCCFDNGWGNGVSQTKIEELVKSKIND